MADPVEVPINDPNLNPPTDPGDGGAKTFTLDSPIPQDIIPEDLRAKPYMKDVQNFEQLFKKLDGSQELIGKRPAGIPAEDAGDEEWAKFYDTMGRPKTSEDYDLTNEVELPENIKRDEATQKQYKELLYKAGLTQKQAKILAEGHDQIILGLVNKIQETNNQQNADFEALGDKVFKDQKDVIIERANKLLKENTPPEMADALSQLPNESLIIMAGVLENIRNKYIKEDGPGGGGPTFEGQTEEEIRGEARKLMATDAFTNSFHKDHAETKRKVDELYGKLRKK